jgi:hypothetical protein
MMKAVATGFIEITNGVNALSSTPGKAQIIAAGGVISFGGLSIFAQSLSFLGKTDLNPRIYFLSKLLHCALSIALGAALFPKGGFPPQESVHVWADAGSFFMRGVAVSWAAVSIIALIGIILCYAIKRLKTSR